PLARWAVLRLAADDHAVLHVEDHLIHDGRSFACWVDELLGTYMRRRRGDPDDPPRAAATYGDFVLRQRAWLDGPEAARQREHWRQALASPPPELALPAPAASAAPRHAGAVVRRRIDPELIARVAATSSAAGVTPFAVMVSAFVVRL